MKSTSFILDLGAWASVLGPVFRQALDPATPVSVHRDLAAQASECLEEAALLGDNAVDAEIPWRALMAGDACFLALEEGFALARFDASNVISLRVETYDGRRWSLLHTGRGMAAFRLAALGKAPNAGAEPTLRVASFNDQRLCFSWIFHPNGTETEELGQPEGPAGPPFGKVGQELAQPVNLGPELLGTGAVLMRRAVASLAAPQAVQELVAAQPPLDPVLPPSPALPASAPSLSAPVAPPDSRGSEPPPNPPARWRLVCMTAPLTGQILPVAALAVMGRDPAAEIHIDNATVSRRHAELRPTDHGMILKDLGSANGTWLGGKQLTEPVLLKNGERFILGECAFRAEKL